MGLFSYAKNVALGKIYKQNNLVNNNIASLLKRTEQFFESKFIDAWSKSCIVSIHVSLEYFLFENLGKSNEINSFRKNIDKLNDKKVFEIIKLLAGYHLTVFEKNKDNIKILKEYNLDKNILFDKIFTIFSFNSDDINTFYELNEEYDIDFAKHSIHLYKKIFEKAFLMSEEKNAFSALLMRKIIHTNYAKVFIVSLQEEINQL